MDDTKNGRRSLRRKPSRQLNLDALCLDSRYCSTPVEQDVLGNETSTTSEPATEVEASNAPTTSPTGSETSATNMPAPINEATSPPTTSITGNETSATKDPAPEDEATKPPTTLSSSSCDVDDDGAFGTGTQSHQISFLYQVQTTLHQTVVRMEEEVLFLLEKALAQQLLTNVFVDSLCSPGNITVVETRISVDQPIDGATVSGFLSDPKDTVLPGVDGVRCRTSLLGNARRCFVVSGALTILSQDDSLSLSWTEPFVVVSAKEMMEKGLLNAVHPDVVDVSYVVDFADGEGPDTNLTETKPPVVEVKGVSEGKKVEPWAWVLLSFGILGIFIACCAFRSRRKRR
ncbi:hypothetical protein FisN_3Lh116 [Fistulifera solaris]|uniref:Uncharacterized protein n=1 Tax=Fistulifera solaris TaxID=1519565 RepID=A0A1Z5KTG0_FISSO|nr:hypothetical protein FisN_3Lh116 [Fistulifera solaris]|eukprot:GAX29624.1 hypothetical protein FisN_3Lh116 [Fistulifera solaris]